MFSVYSFYVFLNKKKKDFYIIEQKREGWEIPGKYNKTTKQQLTKPHSNFLLGQELKDHWTIND